MNTIQKPTISVRHYLLEKNQKNQCYLRIGFK